MLSFDGSRFRVLVGLSLFAALLGASSSSAAGLFGQGPVICAAWEIVPSPSLIQGQLSDVSGSDVADAWAVGYFGSPSEGLILHFDGDRWTRVQHPAPFGAHLNGVVATSAGDAWTVGTGGGSIVTEHWDGTAWTLVPAAPVDGTDVYVLKVDASSSTDAWFVGFYTSHDGFVRGLVQHWDGEAWSVIPAAETPGGELFVDLAAITPEDVWTVGYKGAPGGQEPVAEHWDGATWKVVPVVDPLHGSFNGFYGVSATSSGDVWAAGTGGSIGDGLMEHWDGMAWSRFPPGHAPTGGASAPYSVAAQSPDDAWAVGTAFANHSEKNRPFTEHWDGRAWTGVPAPLLGSAGTFFGVGQVPSGDVWAVGVYTAVDGLTRPLTEHSAGCPQ